MLCAEMPPKGADSDTHKYIFFTDIPRGNPMEVIMKNRYFTSKKIAHLAILLALVIVLQIVGTLIGKLGVTAPSLVLIPIVLGAVLLGPAAGALLGFLFGVIVVVMGATGMDYFTFVLLGEQPVLTALLCLIKGTAAGLVSGFLFRAIRKKNDRAGVIVASLAAPIVNTGLFILGALFMSDTLSANLVPDGQTVLYFLVIGCAGLNFIFEFLINAVASPAIYTVMKVRSSSRRASVSADEEAASSDTHRAPVAAKENK